MAFEIELKVRLDDCGPVKGRLYSIGEYRGSYTKSDAYWFPEQAGKLPEGIRIRRENVCEADGTERETVTVTYKNKTISGGIEVNDERELTVSDAAVFEELLVRLGLRRTVCKEKRGWAWKVPPAILAELSHVAGLGWFLELEILADANDPHTVEESRKLLLDLLARLEIPEEAIEPRPYMALLRELVAVS